MKLSNKEINQAVKLHNENIERENTIVFIVYDVLTCSVWCSDYIPFDDDLRYKNFHGKKITKQDVVEFVGNLEY